MLLRKNRTLHLEKEESRGEIRGFGRSCVLNVPKSFENWITSAAVGGILGAPTTVKSLLSKNVEDFVEYENFKKIIGDDFTYDLDSFKKMKYNEPEKYSRVLGFYNYKKVVPKAEYSDYQKILIEKLGVFGEKSIPPKPIDVSNLKFRDGHAERHGCTLEDAKFYIRNSKCSICKRRWDGLSENYYSDEGATYVDLETGLIKTSFSKKDFDPIIKKVMEVLK